MLDVIVPIYNQRELALGCLASVLEARSALPYELVVVDDCSPDETLRADLARMAQEGRITLLRNEANLGFTKSVNRGMRLHPGRDVLLLNSDTVVHGDWLDRLHRAAYSGPRVATANPLTNASHIGSYPYTRVDGEVRFEISDARLDALAATVNRGRHVRVQNTVGFCLYIRRQCLDDIGYFDDHHFPRGYGEETDFCYRAVKAGWQHVVTGDVFVRHWEGQSFGAKKIKLMANMMAVFTSLHPDLARHDQRFAVMDPIRPLRFALDLARVGLLLGARNELDCLPRTQAATAAAGVPVAVFDAAAGTLGLQVPGNATLPNLPAYALPREIAACNSMLAKLGVTRLICANPSDVEALSALTMGLPGELGLGATLATAQGNNL